MPAQFSATELLVKDIEDFGDTFDDNRKNVKMNRRFWGYDEIMRLERHAKYDIYEKIASRISTIVRYEMRGKSWKNIKSAFITRILLESW